MEFATQESCSYLFGFGLVVYGTVDLVHLGLLRLGLRLGELLLPRDGGTV